MHASVSNDESARRTVSPLVGFENKKYFTKPSESPDNTVVSWLCSFLLWIRYRHGLRMAGYSFVQFQERLQSMLRALTQPRLPVAPVPGSAFERSHVRARW